MRTALTLLICGLALASWWHLSSREQAVTQPQPTSVPTAITTEAVKSAPITSVQDALYADVPSVAMHQLLLQAPERTFNELAQLKNEDTAFPTYNFEDIGSFVLFYIEEQWADLPTAEVLEKIEPLTPNTPLISSILPAIVHDQLGKGGNCGDQLRRWLATDPNGPLQIIAARAAAPHHLKLSPAKQTAAVKGIPPGAVRAALITELSAQLMNRSVQASAVFLNSLPPGPDLDQARASLSNRLAAVSPSEACDWIFAIETPQIRAEALQKLATKWSFGRREEFDRWMQDESRLTAEDRTALRAN